MQALKHAKDYHLHDITAHTTGILFFGTPHRGADAARYLVTLSDILSLVSHKPQSKFLAALQSESVELLKISEDFRPLAGRFNIVSFYEEHAHRLLGKVVSNFFLLVSFLALVSISGGWHEKKKGAAADDGCAGCGQDVGRHGAGE
jgi:hypothetical protein